MNKRCLSVMVSLCFALLGLASGSASAHSAAYFSYALNSVSASPGETVKLNVKAFKTEETAAGFRLNVQYDEDRLDYIGTETAGAVKSGTLRTNNHSGLVSGVYVCNTECEDAPRLSGTVVSFAFAVEPDADAGDTALTVSADQVCNYDGDPLDASSADEKLNLNIQPKASSDASLTALAPSAGTLKPDFSPSLYRYTLKVGSEVDAVDFQLSAKDGGRARVSRTALNRAGKETKITVTVTSEDQLRTAQYMVFVQRAAAAKEKDTVSAAAGTVEHKSSAVPRNREHAPAGTTSASALQNEEEPESKSARSSRAEGSLQEGQGAGLQPAAQTQQDSAGRTLVLTGDRMPSFFSGMMAAAFCIMVGMAVSFWLPAHRRR
ncbi:MAG: cohesin domain-containing protein [Oscillospiraceae bacterium]|nr:cohesin domain-containing protein [Oscillospiraceae bacterium]